MPTHVILNTKLELRGKELDINFSMFKFVKYLGGQVGRGHGGH